MTMSRRGVSPQVGCTPSLRCVICFHLPAAPAQTSGGFFEDCRMTALTDPSRETEAEGTQTSVVVPITSPPFHPFQYMPGFKPAVFKTMYADSPSELATTLI